jgi:hypothetical protein
MKRVVLRLIVFVLNTVAFVVLPDIVFACPSCYGAPDSPMTAGMNMAILSLLGITGVVLCAIAAFIVYLWRRAAIAESAIQQRAELT